MKKLNYMIHLLEENKDEKTQNVTEELVLYMFLGVFTIFVVDSFARAGKYTRIFLIILIQYENICAFKWSITKIIKVIRCICF